MKEKLCTKCKGIVESKRNCYCKRCRAIAKRQYKRINAVSTCCFVKLKYKDDDCYCPKCESKYIIDFNDEVPKGKPIVVHAVDGRAIEIIHKTDLVDLFCEKWLGYDEQKFLYDFVSEGDSFYKWLLDIGYRCDYRGYKYSDEWRDLYIYRRFEK